MEVVVGTRAPNQFGKTRENLDPFSRIAVRNPFELPRLETDSLDSLRLVRLGMRIRTTSEMKACVADNEEISG